MTRTMLVTLIAGMMWPGTPLAFAQSSDELSTLRKEVDQLKEGQATIEKELQEIKNLLRARPARAAPQEVVLKIDGAPAKGSETATVTMVEFTDYQCPFCARYVRDTYPQIERDYIQTGKIRYLVRDLPLESIHPLAQKAAEAAHCAGEQGKYWEMHARLFANQRELGRPDLTKHAQALGLDAEAFDACVDTGKMTARIRDDLAEAQKLQATGTPTFFLGVADPTDTSKIKATKLVGAQPYPAFKAAIERLLSTATK
jgi:protein-disulfide isomerase